MLNYKKLQWDSDFFEFGVSSISNLDPNLNWHEVEPKLFEDDVKLAYLFFNSKPDLRLFSLSHWRCIEVDEKRTFLKNDLIFGDIGSKYSIEQPSIDYPLREQLYSLAYLSGKYSRFKIDPMFPMGKFESMYRIWVDNAIEGLNRQALLCIRHRSDVLGFVTVTVNNSSSRIGLIAVNNFWQGKGLGSLLMYAAENYAVTRGAVDLIVVTQARNTKAAALYQKAGYELVSSEFVYHLWRV